MYKKILVLLDGSERAEAVLPHVKDLATRHEATVVFMRVLEPHIIDVASPFDTHPEATDKKEGRRMEQTVEYLTAWEKKFQADGLDTQQRIERGPVVRTVLEHTDADGIDLVAMTSHGRTGLARVFYGSVTAGILHGINRPLLLVRSS